ncbi:hypothetical protein K3555_08890 [Leisingera sp. M527]|uniref:VpaChn25_0724 family phage protein n=1 Tax=Leisingera sp. M527 TaxID=2867014 RepID=UPI0021A5380C|nr:hypothetical protein [Leisingera sp. M527]UWQ31278.1 hypothetical protein K3555_11725 [Leisingera sp. M527]UWQ31326.1 hypothetical protein K3555_11965 [Leisingera sp. M527]UWQ34581.1 hypothetical protein K3555_08890 [Leisingera sp. M527]
MNYNETLREHARIAILRFIEDAPGYTSNVSMLSSQLPRVGIAYTRDQTETELEWLQEQGLAQIERNGSFVVVTATTRGVEIAQGIARHPKIQRPRPGS